MTLLAQLRGDPELYTAPVATLAARYGCSDPTVAEARREPRDCPRCRRHEVHDHGDPEAFAAMLAEMGAEQERRKVAASFEPRSFDPTKYAHRNGGIVQPWRR